MTGSSSAAFPVEGSYRCVPCRSWRHLKSYADAIVDGPLGPDGQLTGYEFVDDCGLQEGSIRCTRDGHLDAQIELYRDGEWCRFWQCRRCSGVGRYGGMQGRDHACPEGLEIPGRYGPWRIHEGWLPRSRHPDWTHRGDSRTARSPRT